MYIQDVTPDRNLLPRDRVQQDIISPQICTSLRVEKIGAPEPSAVKH